MAGGYRVVVDKARLQAEFDRLQRSLADYRRFLAAARSDETHEAEARRFLREQNLVLMEARVSLGTAELAVALMRHVLRRLSLETLRFNPSRAADNGGAEGGDGSDRADDVDAAATADEGQATQEMADFVASLSEALASAPLEQQEQLHRVLAGMLDFFAGLGDRDAERIEAAMARINVATANPQSRALLREIAIATRDIHNTLRNVSQDLPLDALSASSSGISEAVQRLHSVVARLEDAATQNLDSLEQANAIGAEEGVALGGVIDTLRAGQKRLMQLKADYPALASELERVQARLSDEVGGAVMTLGHHLVSSTEHHMELISNQGFQELTSRTLRKIIEFVQSLEEQLLAILVQHRPAIQATAEPAASRLPAASAAGTTPGDAAEEAPTGGETRSQDEVDKLLAELGF